MTTLSVGMIVRFPMKSNERRDKKKNKKAHWSPTKTFSLTHVIPLENKQRKALKTTMNAIFWSFEGILYVVSRP